MDIKCTAELNQCLILFLIVNSFTAWSSGMVGRDIFLPLHCWDGVTIAEENQRSVTLEEYDNTE